MTEEQGKAYVDRIFDDSDNLDLAMKRFVLLVLKSPRFLYREVDGGDAYDVASRISFDLWDSLPDKFLLQAAAAGELETREQVVGTREADGDRSPCPFQDSRLLPPVAEGRASPDIAKDREKFPGFEATVTSDLRTSLELFLDDVLWGDSGDFRQLLLGEGLFVNGRLAKFYGVNLPDDAPFRKVKTDGEARSGVLTHPHLMANLAYTGSTSPIHRGVFIARSVLGRSLRPPPVAVAPLAPDLHAGLSTRERVILQTSPESCATCHSMINPLGFGLEQYDAVGRFRRDEGTKPVDASGVYESPTGELKAYRGAGELASVLAASEETHSALVEQLFHHLVKQPILAYGSDRPSVLARKFAENCYNIPKLMVDIVAETALGNQTSRTAKVP